MLKTLRRVGTRFLMVAAGLLVMYWEGMNQPTPGVWFVVGAALIALAVIPRRAS